MKFSIYLLRFAVCAQTALALYEDQIGKLDWRRQFIGRPTLIQFDESEKPTLPNSIYVASDKNVVASLDFNSGEIKWRHCFEEGPLGSVDAMLLSRNYLLLIRNKGMLLEVLNAASGALETQVELPMTACNGSKLWSSNEKVYITTCGFIYVFKYRHSILHFLTSVPVSDEIVWLDASDVDAEKYYFVVNTSNGVRVLSQSSDGGFVVPLLDLPVSCSSLALLSGHLICIVPSKNEVILHRLDGAMQFKLNVRVTDNDDLRLRVIDERRFCLVGSDAVQCFGIWPTDGAVEIFFHSLAEASGAIDVHGNSEGIVVSAVLSNGFLSFVANSSGIVQKAFVQLQLDSAELVVDPVKIVVLQFNASSRLPAYVLLITVDNTVLLLEASGKTLWTRYESLSAIVSAELLDLPLSETETIIEKEFSVIYNDVLHMFTNRIVNELHLLKSYLLNHLYVLLDRASLIGPLEWIFSSSMLTRQSKRLVRDHFGWHKMLVVTTESGRLFGMDSKTGQILWTFRIADTELLAKFFPIFVQRTTSTHPYPAQCATVLKNATTGHGVIVTFNPITGDIFETVSLDFSLRHVSLAPFLDSAGIAALLLWPQDGEAVYVFPRFAGPSELLMSNGKSVFLLIVDRDTGVADNFQLLRPTKVTDQWLTRWAVSKVFSLKLTTEEHSEIVDFKMKALNTKVHSQGRVLGNRSVLYKYLNPNIGVALVKTPTQGSDSISVFVFDTVSGRMLYVAKQKRALPPYHLLVCENWIIYSYWNEKYRRTEISVIEMYEGETQTNATAFSSLRSANREPLIYHQLYIFPQRVDAIAVTDTEKAITPRFLMLAMAFGGVVEIPKSFLDPRRAVNLTQELRDEGVIPYTPDLPIATEHIINYNRSVLRVRGIHSSPTGMESTSLVFVFGLDIFLTRVNPSGTFDVLKDGFDHWFIVAVLFALSSAAVITKKLARQKDIMNAWR